MDHYDQLYIFVNNHLNRLNGGTLIGDYVGFIWGSPPPVLLKDPSENEAPLLFRACFVP